METGIFIFVVSFLSLLSAWGYFVLNRKINRIDSEKEVQLKVTCEDDNVFKMFLNKLKLEASQSYIKNKPFLVYDIIIEAEKRGYFKSNAIIKGNYSFFVVLKCSEDELILGCKYFGKGLYKIIDPVFDIVIYKDGLWADISFEQQTINEENDGVRETH